MHNKKYALQSFKKNVLKLVSFFSTFHVTVQNKVNHSECNIASEASYV